MKCFLIMPYGNHADQAKKDEWDALHELIKEVTASVSTPDGIQLQCIRGDHDLHPGEIVSGIVRDLVESPLAIAILTGHNANVFYELGVRHALSNRTILLAENENEVPFDLRTQRMLLFSTRDLAATQRLRKNLKNTLEAIIAEPSDQPDNPIRRYLSDQSKAELLSKPTLVRSDEFREEIIREMKSAFSELISNHIGNRQITNDSLPLPQDLSKLNSNQSSSSRIHNLEDISYHLEDLEGSWINEETATHGYARMTKSGFKVIYCYCGDSRVTGVYEDFRMVGTRIYGRFHWIDNPQINGFTMLRLQGKDLLQGGWWYADSVSEELHENFPQLDEKHPEMIPVKWTRNQQKKFPAWADAYFNCL
jgi:hypothetical protein